MLQRAGRNSEMSEWHDRIKCRELTPRQKEVLDYLCLGKSNSDIGAILGISVATVRAHLDTCRRKFMAGNRTLLVAKYLRPDLFKPKDVVTDATIGREPIVIGKPAPL